MIMAILLSAGSSLRNHAVSMIKSPESGTICAEFSDSMRGVDAASAIGVPAESRPESRARGAAVDNDAPPLGSLVTAAVAIAFAYYVGAMVGMQLRNPPVAPSFLWPPNAILTAVLLIAPPRRRWMLLLATLPAHLLVQTQAGRPLTVALAFFVTNCSEAVIAYLLLRRWRALPLRFDTLRGTAFFIVGAVILAPLISSFADAGVRTLLQGETYWIAFRTRLHGNVVAQLALVPALVSASRASWAYLRRLPAVRWLETGALVAGLLVVSYLVLLVEQPAISTPVFPSTGRLLFLPLLFWAAVRFGPAGVSLALLTGALVALWGASRGTVPFATLSPAEGVLALQTLVIVVGIPLLCVAALIEERRVAARDLERRLRFEELLSRITGAFVHVPSDQMGRSFETALQRLAEYAGAERVVLFRLSRQNLEVAYAWCVPGQVPAARSFPRDEWPWHLERLLREEAVVYTRPAELPDEAAPERERLQALGIVSALFLPLRASGEVVGGLSLGNHDVVRSWSPDIVQQMKLAAEVLANALVRKEAEDALRQSELIKSTILASLDSGVAVLDRGGRIIAVNDHWTRLGEPKRAGREAHVGVGVNYLGVCRQAAAEGDAEARETLAGIQSVLDESRETFSLEYPCRTPDGERWFFMQVLPLRWPDGGAVVSHADITERRHAEAEAERSRQELAHFLRVSTMGVMATSLAHELNQPLAAIMANVQAAARLLDAEARPDLREVRDILADVVEEDKRAGEVIRRLRELLRKGEPERVPLNLNALVREVARLVHSDALIRRTAVKLDLDPATPIVRADRVQIQQVVLNFVLNALEATAECGVGHRTVIVRTQKGARDVQLAVEDEGNGLGNSASRVFEPFYTTKPAGMGMGLSIARSIVVAHGGTISATNNPVRGATFSFTLPLAGDKPA
jgi:signal transduction histidine kinase/integral membrane sensor domain MASE1